MPSKPVLSERDRKHIKLKLQLLCERFWVSQGYKKTSIKELCSEIGIAIGTFYSLFSMKEDLFFETAKSIQMRLTENFFATVQQNASKERFLTAFKELLREFGSKPFLYDVNSPDFRAFVRKLSEENMAEVRFESMAFFREAWLILLGTLGVAGATLLTVDK